jgi:hypothetical protein
MFSRATRRNVANVAKYASKITLFPPKSPFELKYIPSPVAMGEG